MTAIERTAYPRFKRRPSAQELADVYTPTADEVTFLRATARGAAPTLTLAVLLKAFARLGHSPRLQDVPFAVVAHVRSCLRLPPGAALDVTPRTLYKHHAAIRAFLRVRPWGPAARHAAVVAMHEAAQVKEHPADLINVAIEELVRQRFELPAFSALDRLASRIRALVHRRLFGLVLDRLPEADRQHLDGLLDGAPGPDRSAPPRRSAYHELKRPPRKPTLSHFEALLAHLRWLEQLGDKAPLLAGLTPAKVRHFAAEARALDAAELKDVTPPKRYTLLLCLVHRAQVQARDDLVEMFGKRMARIQTRAQEALEQIRAQHRETTEALVATLADVLRAVDQDSGDAELGRRVKRAVTGRGDVRELLAACEAITAYSGDNFLPLMWRFYRSHRQLLFRLARTLRFAATTQDAAVLEALAVVLANEDRVGDWLPAAVQATVDLAFASDQWRRTVEARTPRGVRLARRHFEVCVFSHLAAALKAGDVAVAGSDTYADYREQFLPWAACETQVGAYCQELGFPATGADFVAQLRAWLATTAEDVDAGFPANGQVAITERGEPVRKRGPRRPPAAAADALEAALLARLPERNLLDALANVDHWTHWTRHFGPLSGSEPKLANPRRRYVLTAFTYGCNLGPVQAARHMQGLATAHELSFTNRRHVGIAQLEVAQRDLINAYHRCDLPKVWGTGASAAVDGTKYDLAENSLLAEYSIRYGGYGGIAYHHVADSYIALFSHFIPCGVWEAIYLLEGLLKNTSDVRPTTVHGDTQAQSAPVFGLAHLLGIKLMPRIRNWKDLRFYRPSNDTRCRHIDGLFSDAVDWDLIERHWPDLLQVVLSIKAGTVSSALLLRRLGTHSRRNRLYQAFRELGRVVRTVFLLRYLSDATLREQITVGTNKVEAYNGFAKWLHFGGEGVIEAVDLEEQEKRLKYNHLVANAVAIHNVVDLTRAVRALLQEGYPVRREDLAALSPYQTGHLKRFGDYTLSARPPEPFDGELVTPFLLGPPAEQPGAVA
jgi:TnpA family transposase